MKSDSEIIEDVTLHHSVPLDVHEPAATRIRQAISVGRERGIAKICIAVWSDRTWAVLLFNPAWPGPRSEQIVRAYRAAEAHGLRLPSN